MMPDNDNRNSMIIRYYKGEELLVDIIKRSSPPGPIGKELGSGKFGTVYDYLDGVNIATMVIKTEKFKPRRLYVEDDVSSDEDDVVPADIFPGVKNWCEKNGVYYDFMYTCKNRDVPLIRFDSSQHLEPSPTYYVFESAILSEFLIMKFVDFQVQRGICAHFLSIGNIYTQYDSKHATVSYTMERAEKTLEYIKSLPDNLVDNYAVQILFAVCVLNMFEISHNDLHVENMFLQKACNVEYNGKKLSECTHYRYILKDGTFITIPATKYIIKIGDFGHACKFSPPEIYNNYVMEDGLEFELPTWYDVRYDMAQMIANLYDDKPTRMLSAILAYLYIVSNSQRNIKQMMRKNGVRPKPTRLKFIRNVNPQKLFLHPAFDEFRSCDTIPNANIAILGNLQF
jgi:serine/threonine protein kinase